MHNDFRPSWHAALASTVLMAVAGCGCSSHAPPPAAPGTPVSSARPVESRPSTPPPPESSATPSPEPGARKPASAGQMCGGIAGIQCEDKLYCSFAPEAHCGAADRSGVCTAIPEMCTMEFAPVCGCDGKTYSNACVAGRSSVSVVQSGACPGVAAEIGEGKRCGTRGVAGSCSEGLFCSYPAQCGATDAGGKCTKKPALCPHLVQPVCGCDGATYNNRCEAERAGSSVAANGRCKPQ